MKQAAPPPIAGTCARGFTRLLDVFRENFERGDEIGAALAVMVDGRLVVDLWGGYADRRRTRPWTRDTLVNVFSTTKGLTALCGHRLADRGRLDLDAPVARYWPEFARAGKERITVGMLLNHRAGLPAIRKPLAQDALYRWETMTAALGEETPWWEPGTMHGYHAVTFGYLVGELVRRITGVSLGAYLREELALPLGLDCHIGLAAADDARTAEVSAPAPPAPGEFNLLAEAAREPDSATGRAFTNPPTLLRTHVVNSRPWRAAEIPAANGHATARALARLYGALAHGGELDGARVLRPDAIAACHREESYGPDAVLRVTTRFGPGFMLSQPGQELGPNLRVFGHPGAGGSLGFADLDARVGFGYVMNRMGPQILLDPRARALIAALYDSL